MAHFQLLQPDIVNSVALQIGRRVRPALRRPSRKAGAVAAQIGESFPVWFLGLDATTRLGERERLAHTAKASGYWHHQITMPDGAKRFARSKPTGPDAEDWHVTEVVSSDLAADIDQAIEWIDTNVQGDPLVRLLAIPSYLLTAFWLETPTDDEVLIVDMPQKYCRLLELKHLYAAADFSKLLVQLPHVRGVPARR